MNISQTVLASLARSRLQLVWRSRCFLDLMVRVELGSMAIVLLSCTPGAVVARGGLGSPSFLGGCKLHSKPWLCIPAATSLIFPLLILVAFWLAASLELFPPSFNPVFYPLRGVSPKSWWSCEGCSALMAEGFRVCERAVEKAGLCMCW